MESERTMRIEAQKTIGPELGVRSISESKHDAKKVKLVVVEGKPLGAEIPVDGERLLIGRDKTCGLRPKNPMVSGRQCAIFRRGPHIVVRDLGSTNGTLVNEHCLRRGEEHRVADGDRLQVGRLIFAIRIEEDPVEAEVESWLLGMSDRDEKDASGLRAALSAVTTTVLPLKTATRTAQESAAAAGSTADQAAIAPFAYRRFDAEHQVLRLGPGALQFIDEEQIRAVRSNMFGMVAQPKYRRVVLDLGEIDSLPSMAIALIVALARRCRQGGGELRLCSLSMEVDRTLSRLGIDRVVGCFADPVEARDTPWTDSADGAHS